MLGVCLTPGISYDRATAITDRVHGYPPMAEWMDSILATHALRDTFVVNRHGEQQHLFYLPASSPTPRTAFIIHGYTNCAMGMMHIGYLYHHDLGYNIMLPDLRYHGESQGNHIQMGWHDRLDCERLLPVADSLFGGNTRMVIHGISMGAATTMMMSGDSLPPYVRCFVEDCGYTSAWDEFQGELRNRYHLPPFPLLYTTSLYCKLRHGWSFGECSALRQVGKCTLPMLFIHGDCDTFVPTPMVYRLYQGKTGAKELWISPGSEHADSYTDHPETYTRTVAMFLGRYM